MKFKKLILMVGCFSIVISLFATSFKPGDFYASGKTAEKKIALTFDDGPGPNTEKFLDLLKRENVKATFFVLGQAVDKHDAVMKRIKQDGHEIGSHTWQHINYKAYLKKLIAQNTLNAQTKAQSDLVADMNKTRRTIEKSIGKINLLRMPHGIDGPWVRDAAKQAGFILVNWTYGTDWNPAPFEKQIPGYVKAIKPGAIILLHDGWPESDKSLAIAEAVIHAAKEKGYQMVSLEELLK